MKSILNHIKKGYVVKLLTSLHQKLPNHTHGQIEGLQSRVSKLMVGLEQKKISQKFAQEEYNQIRYETLNLMLKEVPKVEKAKTGLHLYCAYAWGNVLDEGSSNEALPLDAIQMLKEAEYNIVDNRLNLPIMGLEHEFLAEVRQEQSLLICIDKQALHNPQFMYEMATLGKHFRWKESILKSFIFPIKLEDIDFSDMQFLDEINIYWENEDAHWSSQILEDEIQYISEAQVTRYELTNAIVSNLENLLFWIERMDAVAFSLQSEEDLQRLKNIIDLRLGQEVTK